MRSGLIVAATTLTLCGCSTYIARSGLGVSDFKTIEEAHEEFGQPEEVGHTDEGSFETFHTRRKLYEQKRGVTCGLADGVTNGGAEVVLFPVEMFLQTRRITIGQDLRFEYDSSGNIVGILLDGDPIDMRTANWLRYKEKIEEGKGS